MAAPPGQGKVLRTLHVLLFAAAPSQYEVPAAFFSRDLRTARLPGDHEQQQLFQSRPVAGNHPLEAGLEQGLEGMRRLYDNRISRNRADLKMSESRMLYTRCKTTCSKPRSFLGGGRRKRSPSKPHQGRKGNAACEAMEATSQARERQEEAMPFYEQKMSRDRRSRDDLQRHHKKHSCKKPKRSRNTSRP